VKGTGLTQPVPPRSGLVQPADGTDGPAGHGSPATPLSGRDVMRVRDNQAVNAPDV
jgi:hypothetical protein